MRTPQEIFAERICKRLADLAKEMGSHHHGAWDYLKDSLNALSEESFQVIYDVTPQTRPILHMIEDAINDNTNAMVIETQGAYSIEKEILETETGERVDLITFFPGHCTDSQERYAALMVVQHFLSSACDPQPGRLKPAETYTINNYGFVRSLHFNDFAYYLNGVLKEHAIPEKNFAQLDFGTSKASSTPAPPTLKLVR